MVWLPIFLDLSVLIHSLNGEFTSFWHKYKLRHLLYSTLTSKKENFPTNFLNQQVQFWRLDAQHGLVVPAVHRHRAPRQVRRWRQGRRSVGKLIILSNWHINPYKTYYWVYLICIYLGGKEKKRPELTSPQTFSYERHFGTVGLGQVGYRLIVNC